MNVEDVILRLAVAAGVIFVVGTLSMAAFMAQTQAACLKAGYPSSQVDWTLNRYCIKRVDQTDMVVPFHQAVE